MPPPPLPSNTGKLLFDSACKLDLKYDPLSIDESFCCGGRMALEPGVATERREIKPFRLNFIRANDFHRVELRGRTAQTLFLAGPRTQDWGFLDPKTGEYLPWKVHMQLRGQTTESERAPQELRREAKHV